MNTIYRSNIYSEILLILFILGSTLLSVIYSAAGILPPRWLRACLQYLLLYGLPTLYFMRRCRVTGSEIRLVRPASVRSVLLTVALAFLIQAPLMLLSTLSDLVFHNYTADAMDTLLSQPLPLILLSTAVMPAVFEEIACRGLFLSGYRKTHPLTAALLCGIFFGILHLNMQQWVYAFFFGFIISLLCLATNCLWLPILAHFLINATQLLCAYYGVTLFPNLLVVILVTFISLPLMYFILRCLWKPQPAAGYEPLAFPAMKPFLITVLIFIASLFLL